MRLRIALSQRVDSVASYDERRDALDQSWSLMLDRFGHFPFPLVNSLRDPVAYLNAIRPDAIVLTGGNDVSFAPGAKSSASERDILEASAIEYAKDHALPLLAVCRGFQMLNLHLGGSISSVEGHVATQHSVSANAFEIDEVNSYHSYAISRADLASNLVVMAFASDGTVEAAHHRHLPWTCVMWHPERPGPHSEKNKTLVKQAIEGRTGAGKTE